MEMHEVALRTATLGEHPARTPPHAAEPDSVVHRLAADPDSGLGAADAAARLAAHGPNRLGEEERRHYGRIAGRQFADPLVALLVVAAVVSASIGETVEAVTIAAIVVLNAALGFFQEAAAERAMTALRDGFPRRASVVRDGCEREVPAENVVPGDILALREGDAVPADARLLESVGLEVDESALTGESIPVEKDVACVDAGAPLADRRSMVFAGTGITRGRARAVVTGTGPMTELGLVAELAEAATPPPTPLQARLGRLAVVLALGGVVLTVGLTGLMLVRGETLHASFLTGVSVAVAAVPEGLAATVTIALALGASAMAAQGAIVRRLEAIETIGETTLACVDKTGTLTENRLRVAAVRPAPGRTSPDVLAAAALASSADLVEEDGALRVAGDPVDGAILLAALERGFSRRRLLAGRRLVAELPFSPDRRRMSVVYELAGERRLFTKGAPESLLELASVPDAEREELLAAAHCWAGEGFRVLAVAERALGPGHGTDADRLEQELAPVGLVALHDPLRAGAAEAVRAAEDAGVGVWMLTGDHASTAAVVGGVLGLADASIHARVTPAEKLAIVERAQADGEVVLVTGDGVNDAPALRRADVGVAMGRSGTEAAREAAEIVLVDDAFATIVAAIREGRRIADNVRKVVAFLLSANLGEVVLFAIAVGAGLGAPMAVVQVLAVNVLTDGLPALALARDPVDPAAMSRPPRARGAFFSPPLVAGLAVTGLLVGLVGLAGYVAGEDAEEAQTMAFATVALAELAFSFACRSELAPAWQLARNGHLAAAVLASAGIVAAIVYVPWLQAPFATTALGWDELALVVALAIVPAAGVELAKAIARRAGRRR